MNPKTVATPAWVGSIDAKFTYFAFVITAPEFRTPKLFDQTTNQLDASSFEFPYTSRAVIENTDEIPAVTIDRGDDITGRAGSRVADFMKER
jgi:hypothetical protein